MLLLPVQRAVSDVESVLKTVRAMQLYLKIILLVLTMTSALSAVPVRKNAPEILLKYKILPVAMKKQIMKYSVKWDTQTES